MAKLARILKTEMSGDLRALAELLQSKGRGKDTILAHITPAEAKRLKSAGGRGSRNPDTGLLEFDTTDVGSLPEVTVSAPADTSSAAPAYDPGQFAASAPASSSSAGASGGGDYTGIPYTPAAGGGAQGGFPSTQPYSISGDLTPPDLVSQPLNLDPNLQAQLLQPDAQPTDEPAKRPGVLSRLQSALGGKDAALRLGIAGLGGIGGLIQSRKAAGQIGAAQQEQQALAAPYQQQGRALTQAAAAGQLSPASAQAYEAARAQMQQQAAQRGGVGVEQMASQLEGFRQQLLQQQYTYGLQVAQIGDNIALGAIRTGLQLDAQLQQASQGFYTSLAAIAAGVPMKVS